MLLVQGYRGLAFLKERAGRWPLLQGVGCELSSMVCLIWSVLGGTVRAPYDVVCDVVVLKACVASYSLKAIRTAGVPGPRVPQGARRALVMYIYVYIYIYIYIYICR